MTSDLRQQRPGAVHASPVEAPRWLRIARAGAVATAVGAFLAFVGAFGTDRTPLPVRMGFMILMSWAGAGLGVLSFRLVHRLPYFRERIWITALASAVVMTAPMALVVFLAVQIAMGHRLAVRELPDFLATTLVASIGLTFMSVAISRRGGGAETAPPAAAPPPPRFLERLPPKLRGADIWAVESEDHYLRLHTSKGQDLILMRLADAVAELDGIEGAQVHRSWWVARDAIADARRGDGRATLTLKDGSEAPVSRTYAKLLRERGWI